MREELLSSDTTHSVSIDRSLLRAFCLDSCGGERALVEELLAVYLISLDTLLADLARELEAGHAINLRRAAHTLKSSCRIFGANQLAEVCQQVELLAEGGAFGKCRPLIAHIVEVAPMMHTVLPIELAELDGAEGILG